MTESGPKQTRAADKADAQEKNQNPPADPLDSPNSNAAQDSGDGAQPPEEPPKDKRKRGRGAVVLALFALLIALASLLGAGALWYWGQMQVASLDQRTDTVERGLESNVQDVVLPRLQKLAQTQQQLQQTSQAQARKLQQMHDDLTQSRVQLGEMTDKIEGGSRRWKLMEVEDLLLAASQRLQLYKDAGGAQQALNLASQSLRTLNDPRLFKIRENVVNEVAALDALPKPDIEGMALSLGSLINEVPQLPLADKVAEDYSNADAEQTLRLPEAPWQHFLSSVRKALSGMLTIRRDGGSYKPLMPPQQTFFLYQNLQLKLQAGRLALLQKKTGSYSETLGEAQKWLQTYFDTNDSAVAAAIQQLGQMQKIELDWDAPDISGSLTALRAYLKTQSSTRKPAAKDSPPKAGQSKDEQSKDSGPEDDNTAADAAAGGA